MFMTTLTNSLGQITRTAGFQRLADRVTPKSAISLGVRFLYSSEALGLDSYKHGREKAALQFQDLKDKFYLKMKEFSDPGSHNMVFTEDLKHILHLAETEEDLDLVKQMLYKFNSQNKELRFGAYTFGPVVMRLYHLLNQPDAALEIFLHEDFKSFFTQNNSYTLLLDLLFNNQKYEDVVKVFDIVENRQNQGTRYPRSVVILYLAALYKINTPEAFDRVCKLYENLKNAGHAHVRRAVCFAAALANNQGRYNEAIEFLGLIPGQGNYVTMRNLKLVAMCGVKRYDDVLQLLHSVMQVDLPDTRMKSVKKSVTVDVVENLKAEFESLDDSQLKSDFTKVYNQLKEFDHISDQTLDALLCTEIIEVRREQNQENNFTRSRYNADNSNYNNRSSYNENRGRYNDRRPLRRPGLEDLQ